jgi:uncharacterized repeat protein (TIGR01451 family)
MEPGEIAACLPGALCAECGAVISRPPCFARVALQALIALLPGTSSAADEPPPMPAERPGPSEQGAPVATGSGPLRTSTVVELLDVAADGEGRERRQFVPADRVRAGDEVYYTIRVQNPGRTPVANVVVTKQLPFGMHYVRSSAVGPAAEIEFSVDGGESFGPAADLQVHATGQPPRRARVEDYTHVRWRLRSPLAAGATALLRFRATLS